MVCVICERRPERDCVVLEQDGERFPICRGCVVKVVAIAKGVGS